MRIIPAILRTARLRQVVATAGMLSLLAAATSVSAAIVPVINSSFEAPVTTSFTAGTITGWTLSTPSDQGVFAPATLPSAGISATNGSQTAYLNLGNISQTLPALLTQNTAYTLQVDVGDRADVVFPGYRVQLFAGSSLLAEEFSLVPTSGFLTSTVSYAAFAGDPLLGQPLTIRLVSNDVQVNFDNVRLDATAIVPVPASLVVWGLGFAGVGLIVRRRRKVA